MEKEHSPTTLFTVAQAASELKISRQRVQTLIKDGKLHALWILERWAVPAIELQRYREQSQSNKIAA